MGRPKLYENDADKARAYRARQKAEGMSADRLHTVWLLQSLIELRDAVNMAAVAGDAVAALVRSGSPDLVLSALIKHFQGVAASPKPVPIAPNSAAVAVPVPVGAPSVPLPASDVASVGLPAWQKGKVVKRSRPRR